MIRRSRTIVATGLALAVGVSGIAIADGASDNVSTVKGKVSPTKLDKKKFKPAKLMAGVTTVDEDNDPVIPDQAAEKVYIDFDDDIKVSFKGIPSCNAASIEGTTTEQANAACGNAKVSVAGSAKARIPAWPAENNEVQDLIVTGFHGQGNQILLHAFSPTLGPGLTQVVDGKVIKSPLGGDYGQRLSVPDAPDLASDTGALTAFNATIKRKNVVTARCFDKNKKINYRATFVYDDDSTDQASSSHNCKPKKKKKGGRR